MFSWIRRCYSHSHQFPRPCSSYAAVAAASGAHCSSECFNPGSYVFAWRWRRSLEALLLQVRLGFKKPHTEALAYLSLKLVGVVLKPWCLHSNFQPYCCYAANGQHCWIWCSAFSPACFGSSTQRFWWSRSRAIPAKRPYRVCLMQFELTALLLQSCNFDLNLSFHKLHSQHLGLRWLTLSSGSSFCSCSQLPLSSTLVSDLPYCYLIQKDCLKWRWLIILTLTIHARFLLNLNILYSTNLKLINKIFHNLTFIL